MRQARERGVRFDLVDAAGVRFEGNIRLEQRNTIIDGVVDR